MTLQEMLSNVVAQLQTQEQDLNAADPAHPTHGSDVLAKFQAAQLATSSDPTADLGTQFQAAAQAIAGSSNGFTSKAYSDAFAQAAQQYQGHPNQLAQHDVAPIIGALGAGIANHDTRGVDQVGPLGALGPLLGMLSGGNQQAPGGLDVGGILGSLMGNGGAGGALGSVLSGLLGGGSGSAGGALGNIVGGLLGGGQQNQQPQQQGGGLGDLIGGLLGGGGQQHQQAQGGGMGDILGSLLGAVTQGANMTHANGQRDAGASSTGAILTGILGALLKR